MGKIFGTFFIAASLLAPTIALASGQVAVEVGPHRYYDRDHRDWHNWDDHETFAYRAWNTGRNHPYVEWNRLNNRDQRAYWRWRHQHPDADLQVNVR
jgi:hypothetical protein